MFNIFKKKHKYLDCPFLKHSVHFFYDEIRACCSNSKGPVFYSDFDNIDWDLIYTKRKEYINNINKKYPDGIPPECKGCFEIEKYLKTKPIESFENKINRIYFQNNMTCNAKCIYCTFQDVSRGYKYQAVPFVQKLIDKKILSPNACIYMSGGEITISPEFEDLLSLLMSYLNNKIEILTSGIKYCESIRQAFIKNKMRLVISLDSACAETYKKIKQVDCFDRVIENLRVYIEAAPKNAAENITLKYIINDGINDSREEILKFINLVKELGLQHIRMDFDYEKYKYSSDTKVPQYYNALFNFFYTESQKAGLIVHKCEQVEAILNKH